MTLKREYDREGEFNAGAVCATGDAVVEPESSCSNSAATSSSLSLRNFRTIDLCFCLNWQFAIPMNVAIPH